MKRKLTITILSSILISFFILTLSSSLNIRTLGIKGAEEKAELAAELVKSGLTSHMVNGTMSDREYFLKKIETVPNINSLWVTRSKSVIEQFGKGFERENKRNKIDLQVLDDGNLYKELHENSNSAELRVTIPYIATKYGNPNCMNCHNAKEGDVLGTVSMTIDVSDTRANGVYFTAIMLMVTMLIMIIILFVLNRSMNPLITLFNSITDVMKEAHNGNYSKRVKYINNEEEYKGVTLGINTLLDKLQAALIEIDHTVSSFLPYRNFKKKDALIELKELVKEIAYLHNFKKVIEFDEEKIHIYQRIGNMLQERFGLTDFIMVEYDKKNTLGPREVYSTYGKKTHDIHATCRALRTKQLVDSGQFSNICEGCSKIYKYYYCIPYVINNDLDIMIHIGTEDKSIIEIAKKYLNQFEDFIKEARPQIISKNLTEILKISSTTDSLTGLFDRKYLDEYVEKALAQADRVDVKYGVLMIDIDFFKMVNDTYGHDIGDIVIKELADILKSSIRKSDIAFRFGGEEFLVLLYNCDEDKIDKIAEKIRNDFSQKVLKANNGITFSKTLSIGCSIFPMNAKTIWKAIKFADISLYKAKNSGRNRVVQFSQKLLEE